MGVKVPTELKNCMLRFPCFVTKHQARCCYTLLRLGGRQPLCGIGVTSLIDFTWSPAAASAWIADSRPLPGPCTRTCTRFTPAVSASRAACSAATVAAQGVLFLEPLKPAFPDEPHETVLPCMSVIMTVVLLNVAST